MFDLNKFMEFLTDAAMHYAKSAPTVADYLDDLYIRINEKPADVRLVELTRIQGLIEEGTWEHPNYAANRVYHLMQQLGMSTAGQAGF